MKKALSIILSIVIITFAIPSLGVSSVAVKSIRLSACNITLNVGKTYTLKVTITPVNATDKNSTYSSGDKKIATVDKNGLIKGIKVGKTVITVTSSSNKKAVAKCNVTITQTGNVKGKTIVVSSTADKGSGTLRQALLDAKSGYKITFDAAIFPPNKSAVIKVLRPLPAISQGSLTIDASNAGVILDGSKAGGDWGSQGGTERTAGIEINSGHNIIQGLQVVHFSGPGILLNPSARFNLVGGNRNVGVGPLGQGNLVSDTSDGVAITGSDNIITGNLIGTDVTGSKKMGNRAPGVYLDGNASRNVIGPNNIIAFNGTRWNGGGGGVEIRSLKANANNITANSIHGNSAPGICYSINDSTQDATLTTPIILDFDLAFGTIGGTTCPNGIVEIFSTSTADGETYEDTVTADKYGNFSLSKGKGFVGPSLTATSRSLGSNTSGFSAPTSGTRRVLILQKENNLPKVKLQPKRSQVLNDNHVGTVFEGYDRYHITESVYAVGYKWMRLLSLMEWGALNESGIWQENLPVTVNEIPPAVDETITEYANNDITIVLNLSAGAGLDINSAFKTEDEVDQYTEYIRMVVRHFKGRIHYYEIWNEPTGKIEVDDYVRLVKHVAPVIKEEDPDARIAIGAFAGLWQTGYPDMVTIIVIASISITC